MMKLDKDMELIDGMPILYIRSLNSIVCSDLHLGYEGVYASKGVFIPKANLKRIKVMLKEAIGRTGAENVIVVGDIKNEFSDVHIEEFNEFREFMNFLRDDMKIKKITLVKGNHDNFIDRFKETLNFDLHQQEVLIGNYLFFHGEEAPKSGKGKVLVMGHLHPAIAVYDSVGIKEKIRCFLYGKTLDKRRIIVLPAMNFFAEGIDVNQNEVSGVAPVFGKDAKMDLLRALCLGEGEILDFGEVKNLRIGRY
jgi:uncharacterized protein